MSNIIDKEIRGITGKVVWAFLAAYSTILLSVAGVYFTSKSNFQRLGDQIRNESINKQYKDAFFEKSLNQIELNQKNMKNQIYLQEIEITRIKEQLQIK